MPGSSRRVVAVAAVAVVLAVSACGPRYESPTGSAGQPLANDGLDAAGSSPTGALGALPGGAVPPGATATPGAVVPGGVAQPGQAAGSPGAAAPGAAQPAVAARGVTADTVRIGVYASKTINNALAALGATGAFPDPERQVTPIVKWINANGGLSGKKLEIEWHFRDDTSGATDAAHAQEGCTHFVQDSEVFLVTSIYQAHSMAPCLAAAGVPLVETGAGPPWIGVPAYDLGGYYVTPNQISMDRYSKALADGLASRGYFARNSKVGLVYMGYPHSHAAVERTLKPALAAHGVRLTDEQELRQIERASDFAGTQAEVNNAVLRFKSRGIDRVLFLEDQGTTFMTSAEQQNYFPTYGMGSGSLFEAAGANPDSMKNSVIVGVSPALDVLPENQDGPLSPFEATCRSIYLDSGQDPADALAWGLMRWHCEGLFFIKAAVDRASVLTFAAYVQAVESLGDTYDALTAYGTRFGPARYDGVAMARPLQFVQGCTCLKFAGPAYAI